MLEKLKNLFKSKKQDFDISVSTQIDILFDNLDGHTIYVDLGEDLNERIDIIISTIENLRDEIKDECGFILPEVFINYMPVLQENEFSVFIRGKKVANEFLVPNNEGIRQEFYEIMKTVIYANIEQIFTNELAERYIDIAQRKNGWLIWTITRFLSVVDIKTILFDIINNGKSINNIGFVFEKIGEEILTDSSFAECCWKEYNPHKIADEVVKKL